MIPTKTLIPRRPTRLLHRPHLVGLLHRHVDLALTLVSAPAGYGKTSLLIDFCHDAPFPVCWLSLDPADDDLRTLTEYLVAAVRRVFPQFGEVTQRTLNSEGIHSARLARALAGALVQDMLDQIPDFFVLVLDDYHVIDENREINELLTAFLTYRPENCHVILASRMAPAGLPIIQLAARSQIAGIGPTDLVFTPQEVQELLAQMHNIRLSPTQAEELVAHSEGWITGILLSTGASWRGMRDILAQAQGSAAGQARSQQGPIYTYLAEQVFQEQPLELQDFLLISSTLQEMNEPLCREALGLANAAHRLPEIERRGVFITAVMEDDTGTWYRYHHLFHDFLQTRLRQQAPERFQQLHRQVADWFLARQEWERAVAHRLTAGDLRAAAQAMDAALTDLTESGRVGTLLAWYEAVPHVLRSEFPRLLLFAGRALFNLGRLDQALPPLLQAEAIFEQRGDVERALITALQQADVRFHWGQYAEALMLAQHVLERATDYPASLAEAHRLAGAACLNLGRPEQAISHLHASLSLRRQLESTFNIAQTYLDLSLALLRVGQLSEGWACQDQAIELYRQTGPSAQLAMLLNNVAYERYLAGNYEQAMALLSESLTIARSAGAPRPRAFAMLTLADLYRDLGALEQAAVLYTDAQELARHLGDAELITYALSGIAQARLLGGAPVEALGLAVQVRDQVQKQGNLYQLGLSCLTLGAARLACGDPVSARREIEHAIELLTQSAARRDLTRAYVMLARIRQTTGDSGGALAALAQALDLGVETQTYHYLVIEGQRVFELWKRLLERNLADRRPAEIADRIRALPDLVRQIVGGLEPTVVPQPCKLRFYAFGPPRVEKDGEVISGTAWRSALARYLIFYLLTHSPRNRDQIAAAFWPAVSPDKAKSSLHTVKYQAQRALGRSLILFEDNRYHIELDPDCWFDVEVFESLLDGKSGRQARLEQAVELYRGDFMQDFDSEWSIPIRARLKQRFRDALIELGELYIAQERFDLAFAALSRALEADDTYEPGNRALMRLYDRDGRPQAALDHYHKLEQRLAAEGQLPTPETQALYREIQNRRRP